MRTINYVLAAVAALALGGCAITNVNDVNAVRTVSPQGGTAFTQALATEYRARAVYEADSEYEWDDAAWYARKGLMAAQGEVVLPSDVAASPDGAGFRYGSLGPIVQIPAGRVGELSAAHARLAAFFNSGGRERMPSLAAHAQATYDCWLEEEWEQDVPNIGMCRKEFMSLEGRFMVARAEPAPAAMPVAPKLNTYQVFFDFDRSNIGADAAGILSQAAASAKQGTMKKIELTGHTDAAGSDAYNMALSQRRAEAVKAQLIKDGVPASEITAVGVGKAGQLVPTADGVREPQNRRTEILLK